MNQIEWEPGSLANLRHELCTPLNAIIGYSELVVEECKDLGLEAFIPDLQKIIFTSRGAEEIVKKALDPARIETLSAAQPTELIDAELDFQLRTSLNAILGFTELALEDAEDQGCAGLIPDLQKIQAAAILFQNLVGKLRGLKLETSEAYLEYEPPAVSPMSQVRGATPRQQDEGTLAAAQPCGGDVLVVDDNPLNQDILASFLKRLGHTVTVAENGQQALELVEGDHFDLVLLDIMMPVMDGYQVLQHLKGDTAWRDIPIIMISALDEIDSVVRCIEMGAEDYLPKPFNPVLLTARICASLDKKRLRDQEIEYLRNVKQITSAAAAIEAGDFATESLGDVARREDGLGQLARVFQSMAREVYTRELQLKQQVQQLRIELDEARQARRVTEITETEYFQKLLLKAQEFRQIIDDS
jgi:CheY-like chemotaxis protein